MRYPDGGGLDAAGRARRQKVRLQAAQLFEQDISARDIGMGLERSVFLLGGSDAGQLFGPAG